MTETALLASYWTLAGDALFPFEGGDMVSPHDLGERIDAAARGGYEGIGLLEQDLAAWSDRYQPTAVGRRIGQAGLKHVELEMLYDWYTDGERREASDRMRASLLGWAQALGARHIKVGTELGDGNLDLDRLAE